MTGHARGGRSRVVARGPRPRAPEPGRPTAAASLVERPSSEPELGPRAWAPIMGDRCRAEVAPGSNTCRCERPRAERRSQPDTNPNPLSGRATLPCPAAPVTPQRRNPAVRGERPGGKRKISRWSGSGAAPLSAAVGRDRRRDPGNLACCVHDRYSTGRASVRAGVRLCSGYDCRRSSRSRWWAAPEPRGRAEH